MIYSSPNKRIVKYGEMTRKDWENTFGKVKSIRGLIRLERHLKERNPPYLLYALNYIANILKEADLAIMNNLNGAGIDAMEDHWECFGGE